MNKATKRRPRLLRFQLSVFTEIVMTGLASAAGFAELRLDRRDIASRRDLDQFVGFATQIAHQFLDPIRLLKEFRLDPRLLIADVFLGTWSE